MNLIKIIIKGVISPIEVIILKDTKESIKASFIVVALSSVLVSVIAPALYYLNYRNKYEISFNIGSMAFMLCIGILTWLAACTLFWSISNIFKKGIDFKSITASWGFSYFPNLICIIAYIILQNGLNYFALSGIAAVLINTFFIMLLVWKAIYYFLEMKFVMKLSGSELLITTIITAIVFAFLMGIGFRAGIQIPML